MTIKSLNGVAILVDKTTQKFVTGFLPISDRVMMVTLKTAQSRVNLIQVYAPTAEKSDEELEQFYNELQQALEVTKSRDVTIVMGDLNAKIGRRSQGDFIGNFGLGTRNERGDRLAQFCQETDFIVANTYYDLPPRRLYTWKSPADTNNVIRNQIDYLLICKRYQNSIKSVKSYPGADVRSDHNPVVGRFRINLKKLVAKTKVERIQVSRLKDPSTKEQVTLKIKEELTKIEIIPTEDENRKWNILKDALIRTCETTLTPKLIKNKSEWMTDEILDLMEARRSYKTKNKNMYNIINTEIRRKIRDAKERWYVDRCEEIEQLHTYQQIVNLETEGTLLTDPQDIVNELADTYQKFSSNQNHSNEFLTYKQQEEAAPITISDKFNLINIPLSYREFQEALNSMKDTSPDPDDIPIQFIKKLPIEAKSTTLKPLDTLHNTSLRIIHGAYRTTPINSIQAEIGEPTLELRRQLLTLSYTSSITPNKRIPINSILDISMANNSLKFNLPYSHRIT
ncbi:uncharacterized protein, partial [Diabrotica undecimpunctata]|uniref:uncharacterized protein n=1 Tax=Diabrotica undecimpunctata TaxID=50387 RepID=UPI003B63F872